MIRQFNNTTTDQLGKILLKIPRNFLFKFRNFSEPLDQGIGIHVLHVLSGLFLHLLQLFQCFLFLLGGVVQIFLPFLLVLLGLLE